MTSGGTVLTVACFVLWGVAILLLVTSTVVCIRRHRRAPTVLPPERPPPLALIRPLAGVEHRMFDVTRSVLDQDHPDIDIVFAVASETDPAVAHLRDLHGNRPGGFRIVPGECRQGRNPELNNMAGGVVGVRADHLFFSDSNTLRAADAARRWQAEAMAIGGIVSALPEGLDPRSLAAWTECALFDHQFRLNSLLDTLGLPSVHGKAMILSAGHFRTLGGPDALSRFAAEDFAMARAAAANGIPARVSATTARVPLGRRTWSEVWRRQKRWAQYRATMVPISIWAELPVLMIPSGLAGSLAFASVGGYPAPTVFGCHALGWLLVDLITARSRGQRLSVSLALGCLVREAVNPLALLWGLVDRRIEWRGRAFGTAGTR